GEPWRSAARAVDRRRPAAESARGGAELRAAEPVRSDGGRRRVDGGAHRWVELRGEPADRATDRGDGGVRRRRARASDAAGGAWRAVPRRRAARAWVPGSRGRDGGALPAASV